jgi:hypothetical protein
MQTQIKIPAGSLQVQKGRFHMVLHVELEEKMIPVWHTTGLSAEERFRAQAESMLQETRLRLAYGPAFREEFLARKWQKPHTPTAGEKKKSGAPAAKPLHPEQQTVADYLRGWYQSAQPNLARATRTSYEQMLDCRIPPHFEALGITMAELRPPHISSSTRFSPTAATELPRRGIMRCSGGCFRWRFGRRFCPATRLTG